jgi:hypothetical protein
MTALAIVEDDEPQHIPEGYDSVEAFLEEARRRHQLAVDFDRENREQGVEDLEFFAGEQWDTEDRSAREGIGKPCLVINRLPQFVAQVVGDIRINRPAIKVRPADDSDKELAQVREGLIRAIERESGASNVYAETGQSQVACGIGNFRVGLKYAGELSFNRDVFVGAIPDPFAVVWDPLSVEPTGKDARWCFVQDEMDRLDFEATWPDKKPSELEVSTYTTGNWMTADTVKVTEYWQIKERDVEIALLQGGEVVEAEKVTAAHYVTARRTARRKYACMYLITAHAILAGPFEWQIDRVPIIRVRGWEVTVNASKRIRFGLVRFAKDPQRLLNYWRSVAAEYLVMAPKGKWLVHESTRSEDEDRIRTSHLDDDPIIRWSGQAPPQYVPPPIIPSALLQEAQLNAQDMKDVTGLHDASLGARSNETSGRAILARQREGDVATYVYHDNLRAAIGEGGRVIEQLIPTVYDTARTVRIIGEDEQTKVQRINDPNDPKAIDINRGRFDIVVETGPSYTTKRLEAAESMTAFVQAVPAAAPIIADLLATAQDWPEADRIAARLKKLIPPNVLQGEDGEQAAPPPPDPAQQAAGQMQMAQMEAKTRQEMAGAVKAEADAAKAIAEASKAKSEAGENVAEQIAQLYGPVVAAQFWQMFGEPPPQMPAQMPMQPQMPQGDFVGDMTQLGQGMATPGDPALAEPDV